VTTARDTSSDAALRLAQRLVRQGRLDQPLARTALTRAREQRIRLEDALIDCGVSEHILLRHLADLYRTQLISTDKLENAKLSPRVLRMVPKNLAERHLVVPIVLTANGELVVATPDPESVDLIKDVQLASQAREVKTTVARPAAVLAAIRKFYDGDMHAFRSLTELTSVSEGMALEITDNQGGSSIPTATLSERPPPPPAPKGKAARPPSASRQQAQGAKRPGSGRHAAPKNPSSDSLEMARPTASGAAHGTNPPLGEPFPLASDSLFPTPGSAPHKPKKTVPRSEPELELAIDDEERKRLPESGRGRNPNPEAASASFAAPFSMSPPAQEFSSDYSHMGSMDSAASVPPALGFFPSSPPGPSNQAAAKPGPASSLPPSLGFFPSSPPTPSNEPSIPGVFASAFDEPAPEAEPRHAAQAAAGSMPPALGFFSSAPPSAAASSAPKAMASPAKAPAPRVASEPSIELLSPTKPTAPRVASEPSIQVAPAKFPAPRVASAPSLELDTEPIAARPAPVAPALPASPASLQQWMAALDSSPPPDDTGAPPEPLSSPPQMSSPLSIPPAAGTLDARVPYMLTEGQGSLQAPLLFARSFVALLERGHGALAAHSIVLAELTRLLAADCGLGREEQEHVELGALLHDIGKSKSRHLTAFSIWYYVEYEQIAREQYLLPLQMFSSSGLSDTVIQGLSHLYERADGRGFPNGLSGNAIPQLSRLIALCDSYLDLVLHAGNPFGRPLSPREALSSLRDKAGTVFDPVLVERLTNLITEQGIDVRARQRQVTI